MPARAGPPELRHNGAMTDDDPMPAAHQLRADADTPITIVRAGTVPYELAWSWQRDLAERRLAGEVGDVVLLLEHPAVYTAGRRADRANLVFDTNELSTRGIDVVEVDRGGDFTYHGPGQLVGYPVLKLKGIRGVVEYVRALEEVNLVAAGKVGVSGRRVDGFTGVWVDRPASPTNPQGRPEKLTAIGVRVSAGGITQHGFATNVTTDLSDFAGIIPCGITDMGVCSLESLGVDVDMAGAADLVVAAVADVLRCEVRDASPAEVGLDGAAVGLR